MYVTWRSITMFLCEDLLCSEEPGERKERQTSRVKNHGKKLKRTRENNVKRKSKAIERMDKRSIQHSGLAPSRKPLMSRAHLLTGVCVADRKLPLKWRIGAPRAKAGQHGRTDLILGTRELPLHSDRDLVHISTSDLVF
jgi:hypothetical protein